MGDIKSKLDKIPVSPDVTVTYDGKRHKLIVHPDGIEFDAFNNTVLKSKGPWPDGQYKFSHESHHPGDINGSYGSGGNVFVFSGVHGREGMGIHAGRADKGGPKYPTLGCIRVSEECMRYLEKNPPIRLEVVNNSPPKEEERFGGLQCKESSGGNQHATHDLHLKDRCSSSSFDHPTLGCSRIMEEVCKEFMPKIGSGIKEVGKNAPLPDSLSLQRPIPTLVRYESPKTRLNQKIAEVLGSPTPRTAALNFHRLMRDAVEHCISERKNFEIAKINYNLPAVQNFERPILRNFDNPFRNLERPRSPKFPTTRDDERPTTRDTERPIVRDNERPERPYVSGDMDRRLNDRFARCHTLGS